MQSYYCDDFLLLFFASQYKYISTTYSKVLKHLLDNLQKVLRIFKFLGSLQAGFLKKGEVSFFREIAPVAPNDSCKN